MKLNGDLICSGYDVQCFAAKACLPRIRSKAIKKIV